MRLPAAERRTAIFATTGVLLFFSLVFAVVQVVVGRLLLRHVLAAGRWRVLRFYLGLLLGIWLLASGLTELVVSGMEVARYLIHQPDTGTFTLWRGRADAFLLLVTVVVLLLGLAYPLVRRTVAPRRP